MVGFRILRLIESKVKKESLPLATNLARVEVCDRPNTLACSTVGKEKFYSTCPFQDSASRETKPQQPLRERPQVSRSIKIMD
jgi:hypothetical protein